MSETAPRRHLTAKYCEGNGVDIGSGGDPVVPWAISVDLPDQEFHAYGHAFDKVGSIHWKTTQIELPFKDGVLDFVYSSHLLEDFLDWDPVLKEWTRVLKVGGNLVILIPCKIRYNELVSRGIGGNAAHKHEGRVGELTELCGQYGLKAVEDRYTDLVPEDYNILFVGRKIR